jgi:hypothetical protein
MPSKLCPLQIIVRGAHDTGKTTVANFIKMFLLDEGFSDVVVKDVPPLPQDMKAELSERIRRNKERPIRITVELGDPSKDPT